MPCRSSLSYSGWSRGAEGKARPRVDRSEAVWVLDEDPELGRGVPSATRADLWARAIAPLVRLAPGEWDVGTLAPTQDEDLGVLVLDGLLARNVLLADRSFVELLGPEDLLRPRDDLTDQKLLPADVTYTVMRSTRLAVLDRHFARRIAPWLRAITPVLLERTVRRARWLTLRLAMLEVRRTEDRLLLLLWHLADRWGRIQPDGVCVSLSLTHEVLGRMVCAHRSSVTTALNRLVAKGALVRGADGCWVLQGRSIGDSRSRVAVSRRASFQPVVTPVPHSNA